MKNLLRSVNLPDGNARFASLAAAEENGLSGLSTAPRSIRVLVENIIRSSFSATPGDVAAETENSLSAAAALILASSGDGPVTEVSFRPTRLILQDHSGIPVLADMASLRSLMAERGLDPRAACPALPVDLVVDHSVEVASWARPDALRLNMGREHRLNRERYRFLRWAQQEVDGLRVVPPGKGIVHQMHLEHLARVVMPDAAGLLAPDTVLGTDSHTPMVGALGVLGWGVGGIEAETALLGHPVSLLSPLVTGVRLTGALPVGSTATDLALTMTEFLRRTGVVGQFVEFFGPGVAALEVPDRATLANMAPEYGCTVAFFPVDETTLAYLRLTGRPAEEIARIEAYTMEQGLFVPLGSTAEPHCARVVEFDLSAVVPVVAGPRRPQDRLPLVEVPASFPQPQEAAPGAWGPVDGAIGIAAITSCTNTSNPVSMVTAGLVARQAVERGLEVPDWVKTSLAPGSRTVVHYLDAAGLLPSLEKLGFSVAGFGCTTCIGNSGDLSPVAAEAVRTEGVRFSAVLSGNRNFEGRIHPDVAAAYLASPALVVAFALAGTVLTDLTTAPLGTDQDGTEVRLADLWPAAHEVAEALASVRREHFGQEKHSLFEGDEQWRSLDFPSGAVYDWPADSDYLVRSPFFDEAIRRKLTDLTGARVLVRAGDATTTDHISPAGAIAVDSPAGRLLSGLGIPAAEFNSYGCRRGNHEVLVRGTFANPKFRNGLTPDIPGSNTVHLPTGKVTGIHEAAAAYAAEGIPVVVLAGKDYGFGSSRDWAAKGPALLGVRAVLAESFERIHRSNLVGMGIVPLQFLDGDSADSLGLTGREAIDIVGLGALRPRGEVAARAHDDTGAVVREWTMRVRVDTAGELDYVRRGGFLHAVADTLMAGQ
ncbi:aconitate hydratase AcnA (plasmid) [Streptomyces scopuliridis]|uniref:aconitate hydratase AcnA n=1 Tax=Streptomyces scopuliridis TaxID=452529 RepID=UPI002DD9C3B0|nr:aconitate hydratase AcnA [Streptomyces scopuliridis]WSB39070.1 aconitate hydratase AcnA [Streptomyces scopuliridis]